MDKNSDTKPELDLATFMPYLLNQAADASSRGFQAYYKSKYGMLRTEWRVIFHIGRYRQMTAKEICTRSQIHKTKVSRAVHALEAKGYLRRESVAHDRRQEQLELTPAGSRVFEDLCREAARFDAEMLGAFSAEDIATVRRFLAQIAQL